MTDLADGAAFDPAQGTWRVLAAAPSGLRGSVQVAAWTGSEFLVVAHSVLGNETSSSGGARYRPADDAWTPMAVGPIGDRYNAASVWTGAELLVVGGHGSQSLADPAAMAYSPTTNRWRVVDTPDFVPRRSVNLAWTGTTVLAVGLIETCAAADVGPCGNLKPALAAFDPHTSRWSALNADALGPPGNPDYVYGFIRSAFWTGHALVVVDRTQSIVIYQPDLGQWSAPLATGCAHTRATGFDLPEVWTPAGLLLVCPTGDLYQSSQDVTSWTKLAGAPPLEPVQQPVMQWTGHELLIWGGQLSKQFSPTSDTGALLAP